MAKRLITVELNKVTKEQYGDFANLMWMALRVAGHAGGVVADDTADPKALDAQWSKYETEVRWHNP